MSMGQVLDHELCQPLAVADCYMGLPSAASSSLVPLLLELVAQDGTLRGRRYWTEAAQRDAGRARNGPAELPASRTLDGGTVVESGRLKSSVKVSASTSEEYAAEPRAN